MTAQRRREPTPWRDPLPTPGPVVIFDIDGVLADMREFEHLIEGRYSRTRWNRFHKNFGKARPIRRNVNLLQTIQETGMHIAYSTTRPESAAQATWDWLSAQDLPHGPIMTRHAVLDGQRFSDDVTVRHWFEWLDQRANLNPVLAWIDDEETARNALIEYGCPAWDPDRLRRFLTRHKDVPLIRILTERVSPPSGTLSANLATNGPEWRTKQARWESRQKKSWRKRKQQQQG